jgi:hypothetical protein
VRFSTLLSIAGFLGVLFGLIFFFAPQAGLQQYSAITDPTGLFLAQFFGSDLIYIGLLFLVLRTQPGLNIGRIALVGCIGELLGLSVAVRIQLTGAVSAMGWSTVAIYGLLALAFAAFAIRRPSAA